MMVPFSLGVMWTFEEEDNTVGGMLGGITYCWVMKLKKKL